jgi:hypothetical protein
LRLDLLRKSAHGLLLRPWKDKTVQPWKDKQQSTANWRSICYRAVSMNCAVFVSVWLRWRCAGCAPKSFDAGMANIMPLDLAGAQPQIAKVITYCAAMDRVGFIPPPLEGWIVRTTANTGYSKREGADIKKCSRGNKAGRLSNPRPASHHHHHSTFQFALDINDAGKPSKDGRGTSPRDFIFILNTIRHALGK